MQELLGIDGSLKNVPHLPEDLETAADVSKLIPKGFEDYLQVQIRSDSVVLTLTNDEYKDNEIIIPNTLYSPKRNKVLFPKFLIERSISNGANINYLEDTSEERYVFNQNEILYIALQHRLVQLCSQAVAYSSLLRRDISSVLSFVQYIPCIAYNAIKKNEHSYIVMAMYDEETGEKKPQSLGDLIHHGQHIPSAKGWQSLKESLPIQCSSESGCSKTGKLILYPYSKGTLYRSVGHAIYKHKTLNMYMMKSLFKSAQNITARNKTHVTSNAYEVFDFKPTSVFAQDWIYNLDKYPDTKNPVLEGYEPKDHCYRRALIVIRPMRKDNHHLLFGEVEMAKHMYDTCVWENINITDNFDNMIIPEDGSVVYTHSRPAFGDQVFPGSYTVATAEDGELDRDIVVEDILAIKFVKRKPAGGPLGREVVTLRVARKAGNARIDSNTGLKGVTKGKPYLGKITMQDGTTLKPDMVLGMNSFKAKENGIALARAALATDLGHYTPKNWSGLLNTLDQAEINEASSSLQTYTYQDEFGNICDDVQIGVVYYRYTEIAEVFKSYKAQSLSHEMGRNMYYNKDNALFDYIWDTYVTEESRNVIVELQKILCNTGDFKDESLPKYTPKAIYRQKLFTEETDVISSTMSHTKVPMKILDEDFNPEGFFIDLRPNKGPLIRMPSAKLLKLFEMQLDNGSWMYHSLFISIGKIIKAVLRSNNPSYNQFGFIFQRPSEKRKRVTLQDRYLQDVKGMLFTTDEAAEMKVSNLTRPMVPGMAMKQVVDVLLPESTVVIMCKKTYYKALKNAYGENYELLELQHGFHGLHGRSPFLWRGQLCKLKIWSADDFRVYLMATHGISIDDYLLTHENHDVIIFSPDVSARSHSDCDK